MRHLSLEPDPATLPADPAAFAVQVRMLVGPADGLGEESVDLTVCSPEWLAARCRGGEMVDGHHHVIVDVDLFDRRKLQDWLRGRVGSAHGETWAEVGMKLGHIGHWEFEDHDAE
jgi:hypothetical protein